MSSAVGAPVRRSRCPQWRTRPPRWRVDSDTGYLAGCAPAEHRDCPAPTHRTTSCVPVDGWRCRVCDAGCAASRATSTTSCRSRRWSPRWGACRSATPAAPVVPLDAIVGTVDRLQGFDRHFRPTTPQVRARWERIAAAMRRGEPMPPVDLYRVGEVYFVKDGHHRVSVARALGRHDIDARVTRGRDARRCGPRPAARRPAAQEPRAGLPGARAAAAASARARATERPVGLRRAGRGRSRRGAGAGPRSTSS